jgi:hypothetical protein
MKDNGMREKYKVRELPILMKIPHIKEFFTKEKWKVQEFFRAVILRSKDILKIIN